MRVVDSHTGRREPTRLIIEGGPSLGHGPLSERRRRFAEEFDNVRRFAILCRPRGYDALVGALLCELPGSTRRAPPASSSSTTPAISGCAVTPPSAPP